MENDNILEITFGDESTIAHKSKFKETKYFNIFNQILKLVVNKYYFKYRYCTQNYKSIRDE